MRLTILLVLRGPRRLILNSSSPGSYTLKPFLSKILSTYADRSSRVFLEILSKVMFIGFMFVILTLLVLGSFIATDPKVIS